MANLLITTLGTSWQIVPELYGFTNPRQLDLYRHHSQQAEIEKTRQNHNIRPVSAIWIVTTARMNIQLLKQWAATLDIPLTLWWPAEVDEIATAEENTRMAEVIYRAVLQGKEWVGKDHLYLSLAGGRKTMSAEMQQAGLLFGCAALLHVVDRRLSDEQRQQLSQADQPRLFAEPLHAGIVEFYQPLVIMPAQPGSVALEVDPPVRADDYPLPAAGGEVAGEKRLHDILHQRLKSAESLMYNFSSKIDDQYHQSSFHGLYSLPPALIRRLTTERIAADPARRKEDLHWLQQLPKADLHCHLGGVLDAAGMIEVARTMSAVVAAEAARVPGFADALRQLQRLVAVADAVAIRGFLVGQSSEPQALFKVPRRWHEREPLGVCGFLLAFEGQPELLDSVIHADLKNPRDFVGVGIGPYEALGDLQGSGLLQCEETLRGTCAVLKRTLREDRVRYLELRCSPNNYTRGGLTAARVVEILLDELKDEKCGCDLRLLLIASRHRKLSEALSHIELVDDFWNRSQHFRECFVGFDLAGDEQQRSPAQMRSAFMPLLEKCISMTIHAGEDQDVKNIWEAVYELSADRVGHGLTLKDNGDLFGRFVERRIAVEMCPSSNFQIVGFADWMLDMNGAAYPLQQYLAAGMRVTINTDNPGISRTTMSNELYKAAAMVKGGLTRWQILQLIRNSFKAAFCERQRRRELLRACEADIVDLLATGGD